MTTILNLSRTPDKVTIDAEEYRRLLAVEEATRDFVRHEKVYPQNFREWINSFDKLAALVGLGEK